MDILYSICESSSGVPFVLLLFFYRVRGPTSPRDFGVRFGMRSVTGRNTVKVDPGWPEPVTGVDLSVRGN